MDGSGGQGEEPFPIGAPATVRSEYIGTEPVPFLDHQKVSLPGPSPSPSSPLLPLHVPLPRTLYRRLAALNLAHIARVTSPTRHTTTRPRLSLHFGSSLPTPLALHRRYSTPKQPLRRNEQPHSNEKYRLLGHLEHLLSGHGPRHHEQTTPSPQHIIHEPLSARPVAALLQPSFYKIDYKETPAERWRSRGFLRRAGQRSAGDGCRDSPPDRLLAGSNGQIVFKDIHRQQLRAQSPSFLKSWHGSEEYPKHRMRSFVQLLTTPTADTPGTTLLLHFDNKRYLIGSLAEGTQRACVQMGARLLKVSDCFLTGRTEWKNTGGMIGMLLTLADSSASSQASTLEEALKRARSKAKRLGILDDADKMRELEDDAKKQAASSLNIFGPPNLNYTLATARRYVFRKGMPLNVHEIRDDALTNGKTEDKWDPFWTDEYIKVWAMSVSPFTKAGQTTPSSISPRKRSIDEVYAQENGTGAAVADELSADERNYLTAKAVVSEMFNSSWRLDTLYDTPLNEVKLPATIFVRNAQTNKIEKYTGPLPGGDQPVPDPTMKVLVRRPWPGALVESLPHAEPAKEAISYIIRNHTQRGKFRPDRAKELKVPQGKAWADLAKGESFTNADGQVITSDMVLEPSRTGGGIAVVDLPSKEYIDNLIGRPEWREPAVMEGVGAIMWICGKDVASDTRLHSFMEGFSNLEHIVSSPDYCPNNIALDSAAAATVRLKQVDPDRYCVPVHDSNSPDSIQMYGGSSTFSSVREEHPLPAKAHIAARGQILQLEPAIELQTKEVVPELNIAETIAEMPIEVLDEAAKAREAIKVPDNAMDAWRESLPPGAKDAEIITLGTGSALPSKYRNVSATLVLVPGWGNVLLDCGENTLGQLKRVFKDADFKQMLRELRVITISHMHADHQLGTTSVVKAWYEEVHNGQPLPHPLRTTAEGALDFEAILKDNDRLAIISEPAMQSWLAEYSAVEDFGYSRVTPLSISAADVRGSRSRLNWYIPPEELKNLSRSAYAARIDRSVVPASLLNLKDIQAVLVRHCHGARAMSLTMPSGFKVSYSGDCRPSKPFAYIGRGSTVCIHEATFDDELQGDAEAKNHSTTSEALGVAQNMGAKACVLTHFSQRYQKVPVLERDEQAALQDNIKKEDDILMTNGEIVEPIDESTNPEDALSGPLEDVAETFPDQATSNGKQYELPAKVSQGAPEAVKFKLKSDMKVCVAFDYMRVRVGDIGLLEKFTPALLKLFEEDEKEKEKGELRRSGSKTSLKEGKKGKNKKGERRN